MPCNHCQDESRCERMGICQAFRLLPRVEPLPAQAETSGETLDQREEVCAAWADLPAVLTAHPAMKRLYRALGGIRPRDGTDGVKAVDSSALIDAADKHSDLYEGREIPANETRAAINNAFFAGARFATLGVKVAPYQVVAPSDAGGGKDTP